VSFRLSEESASLVLQTAHLLSESRHVPFFRKLQGSKRSPPTTLLIQIPVSCAPSQTGPPISFSCQTSSAPRSATRGSPPATPAGPGEVGPPQPTRLRSSSRGGHLARSGAIAVPPATRPRCRRSSFLKPRAMTRLEPARNIREAWKNPLRSCLACRRKETPKNEKRRQQAAGRWQLAANRGEAAGRQLGG